MKSEKFSINVPEPCHEDWNKMKPEEKGRFCSSCSKTVVDFTKMDNENVAQYMNEHDNVCGRFTKLQVNTVYSLPKAERFQLAKFAAACLLVFGFNLFSYSCGLETPHVNLLELVQNDKDIQGEVIVFTTPPDSLKKEDTIKSLSVEEIKLIPERNLQHITGVSVITPEPVNNNDTNKDLKNCENLIPEKAVDNTILELDTTKLTNVDLQLIGFVAIDYLDSNQSEQNDQSLTPPVATELISEGNLKLFPNPANEQTQLEFIPHIENKNFKSISIIIKNAAGQIIKDETYSNEDEIFVKNIDTSNLPNGIYYIEIIHGVLSRKTKLIVSH